jgi:hypothetical protein
MLLPTLARSQRTRIITSVAQGERAFDEIAPRSIAVTSKKNAATEIENTRRIPCYEIWFA